MITAAVSARALTAEIVYKFAYFPYFRLFKETAKNESVLFLAKLKKMRTIREELLEMRDKLDELIKQLEAETEVISPAEDSLENIIFNAKLFNTPERLTKLKQTIENFFSDSPTNEDKKINVRSKNQFFCLYAAL